MHFFYGSDWSMRANKEPKAPMRSCHFAVFCLISLLEFEFLLSLLNTTKIHAHTSGTPVKLHVLSNHLEIDNGILKLSLLRPSGQISGIRYQEIDNLLEYRNKENQRGYWDIVWRRPDNVKSFFDTLDGTHFKVIAETEDQVEVSFTRSWNASSLGENSVPLSIDKRFVVLRGASGFYSYAIFEHFEGWPDLNVDEARIAFKLNQDKFNYMAISDDMQRVMPTDSDRRVGHVLGYREAVLITTSSNPRLEGQVDDKYQYSCDNKDSHLHGWISSDPSVGFWVITPSDEFRAGGPVKTDLTSHAGPTSLAVFFSGHYAGPAFGIRLQAGEKWKKVFGPVFIYLNSGSNNKTTKLWDDAKKQMYDETEKWPYNFPLSKDFPRANHRGTISGRLIVRDRYLNKELIPAKSAHIGLAPPGGVGSWQDESKGYQFWTKTDETGHFTIRGIRANTYNIYAWVPGIMGDYKHEVDIIVRSGKHAQIGDLVFDPPRNGPTLWEIGIPDRTAAEFYVPDPVPGLVNKLFINHKEKFRQYGLWDRYTDLYPTNDLTYTVGVSDYRKDWFFAHVNRNFGHKNYGPTTWRIYFNARNVRRTGAYTLRLALASANYADIQVWINNPYRRLPDFSTGRIGRDNTIARHGIHGRYWLYSVGLSGFQLVEGRNTIYLRQAIGSGPFPGVMYDYIRLEGPPQAYT